MKIREATREDASAVGALVKEFCTYLQSLGDDTNFQFNAETYMRDGFGDEPAFKGLVAENHGEIVGYLLYHFGYYVDIATRIVHIVDLYVRPDCRCQGIGSALMERTGEICVKAGGKRLFWSVYSPNRDAFRFYKRLGARYTKDLKFMYLTVGNRTGTKER